MDRQEFTVTVNSNFPVFTPIQPRTATVDLAKFPPQFSARWNGFVVVVGVDVPIPYKCEVK
jgi:hypothetical protein